MKTKDKSPLCKVGMNAYNLGLEDTALRQNVANYNQSAASNRAAAKSSKRTATIGAILSFASSMAGIQSMQAASKKATDAVDTTAGINKDFDWSATRNPWREDTRQSAWYDAFEKNKWKTTNTSNVNVFK